MGRGAYGFQFEGIDSPFLNQVPDTWPVVEVSVQDTELRAVEESVSETTADVMTGDVYCRVTRRPPALSFSSPAGAQAIRLAHPYLTRPLSPHIYWQRWEAFHAGGFCVDGKVWGVAALSQGGKSSLLAGLAKRGLEVLSDDMVVVSQGSVFAGPRSIDLREEAAERLGMGDPIGLVGFRNRWRIELPGISASLPVAGWVFLTWSANLAVEPIGPGKRLAQLIAKRAVHSPSIVDPAGLLALAAKPAYELTRPPEWAAFGRSLDLLLRTVTR